jgi:hypothetical protein
MRTARRITAARIDDDELVERPVSGLGIVAGQEPAADSVRCSRTLSGFGCGSGSARPFLVHLTA